jgi:hypothetical protein
MEGSRSVMAMSERWLGIIALRGNETRYSAARASPKKSEHSHSARAKLFRPQQSPAQFDLSRVVYLGSLCMRGNSLARGFHQ